MDSRCAMCDGPIGEGGAVLVNGQPVCPDCETAAIMEGNSWREEAGYRASLREMFAPRQLPLFVERPEFPVYVDAQGREHSEF